MLAPVGRWKVSGTQGPVFKWECQHLAFTGAVRAWIGHKAANAREHGRKGLNGTVPKREKRWSRLRRQVDSSQRRCAHVTPSCRRLSSLSLPRRRGHGLSPLQGREERPKRSGCPVARREALERERLGCFPRRGCGRHADGWGHSGPGRRGALYFEEHYTHRVAIKSKLKDAK